MQLSLVAFCLAVGLSRVFARLMPPAACCLRVTKLKVNVSYILRYNRQEAGHCPIQAVIFYLKNGTTLCANPDRTWTKQTIQKLDQRSLLLQVTNSPLNSRWPPEPTTKVMQRKRHHSHAAGTFINRPKKGKKIKGFIKKVKTVRIKGGKKRRGGQRQTTKQPNTTAHL